MRQGHIVDLMKTRRFEIIHEYAILLSELFPGDSGRSVGP